MIARLCKSFFDKGFATAFWVGFGFHITISMVLFILLYVVNYSSNSCRQCDSIMWAWNSISMVVQLIVGTMIPNNAPFELYRFVNKFLVPIFLITPISFGLLFGYASVGSMPFCDRFKKGFLYVYLPVWIITAVIAVLWVGFDILIF